MATYNVGLNAGNTGSLVCVSLSKSAPGSSQVGVSSYLGSTSLSIINRMVFLASFPVSGSGTVTNAKLRLANADAMSATTSLELRKLLNTFVKAQATWSARATATGWAVPGALGGSDVDPDVIATGTTPIAGSNAFFDITGSGLNAWVQGCINGSIAVPALIVSKLDDTTSFAAAQNRIRTDTGTDGFRPVLIFDFVPDVLPTITTVNVLCTKYDTSVTIPVTLSDAAKVGGVSGTVNTADITAIAGVDYTAQTGVAFSIPEGSASGTITIPILP